MSSVSQTPSRKPLAPGLRFALIMTAAVLLVALAMENIMAPVFQMAARAHPHLPDLTLFLRLSPVIQLHLVTALAALALGAVLMTARKGRTFHRVAGWIWVSLVSVTAGATLFIAELNHGAWSLLHLFTGWVLIILPLAVFWAKRREIRRHRRAMMGLFYGGFAVNLVIAFIPGRTLWMMFFG